jgi:hypothetical protein
MGTLLGDGVGYIGTSSEMKLAVIGLIACSSSNRLGVLHGQ